MCSYVILNNHIDVAAVVVVPGSSHVAVTGGPVEAEMSVAAGYTVRHEAAARSPVSRK